MRRVHAGLIALSSILLLSGCVTQPLGPSFSAMPPQGKSLQAFNADEDACEQYAGDRVAGRVKEANDRVTTSTIVGTALGAGPHKFPTGRQFFRMSRFGHSSSAVQARTGK